MKDIFQIKISLDNAKPSIYRTILVESDTNFFDFHEIIQVTMGWENDHLFQFETSSFRITEPDEFIDSEVIEPDDISLNEVFRKTGDKIKYEYDFGDSWRHTIKLEKILPLQLNKKYPTCIRGKRSCPPEDCGGIWGYENLKEIINDIKHPDHKEMIEWLGGEFNPDFFDIIEVNEILENIDYYFDGIEDYNDESIEDFEYSDNPEKEFQNHLFNIVNEQMDENEPPETATTFKKLINSDFSHLEAKILIAKCVSYELMSVITDHKPFNMTRFITNLNKLPNTDFEK